MIQEKELTYEEKIKELEKIYGEGNVKDIEELLREGDEAMEAKKRAFDEAFYEAVANRDQPLYYTAVGIPNVELTPPNPKIDILVGKGRRTSHIIDISLEEYIVWDTCSRKIISEEEMLDKCSELYKQLKKQKMTLPRAITELTEKGLLLSGRTKLGCIRECFYLPLLSCTNHLFAHGGLMSRLYIHGNDVKAKRLPEAQKKVLEAYKKNLALNIEDYFLSLSSLDELDECGDAIDSLLRNKFLVAMGKEDDLHTRSLRGELRGRK